MTYTEFSVEAGTSGYISLSRLGGYVVSTGSTCVVGGYQTVKRAFLNYDTDGGIPEKAIVYKMEIVIPKVTNSTGGSNPGDAIWGFAVGTFIGVALTSADWSGGTAVTQHDWATGPIAATIDLSSTALSYYNNSGDTDIRITDSSDYTAGDGDWSSSFSEASTKLRVYWYLPQVIKINT